MMQLAVVLSIKPPCDWLISCNQRQMLRKSLLIGPKYYQLWVILEGWKSHSIMVEEYEHAFPLTAVWSTKNFTRWKLLFFRYNKLYFSSNGEKKRRLFCSLPWPILLYVQRLEGKGNDFVSFPRVLIWIIFSCYTPDNGKVRPIELTSWT